MVFSDQIFLFGFLPLALLLGLPSVGTPLRGLVILILSLVFFWWSSGDFTLLLIASIAINFLGGHLVYRWRKRGILWAILISNFAVLGWFKYAGFVSENLDAIFGSGVVSGIVLPIGISFYTWFRALYFFPVVIFGWVLFNAPDLAGFMDYSAAMLSPLSAGAFLLPANMVAPLSPQVMSVMTIGVVAILFQGRYRPAGVLVAEYSGVPQIAFVAVAGLASFVAVLPSEFSPFLYFRF